MEQLRSTRLITALYYVLAIGFLCFLTIFSQKIFMFANKVISESLIPIISSQFYVTRLLFVDFSFVEVCLLILKTN